MPKKIRYLCDCPDYTQRQSQLFNSNYESQWADRDWSDTDAVLKEGGICKHIYSVLIARGELQDVPRDMPYSSAEELEPLIKEKYQQGYAGHDFNGNWGVSSPNRYRGA